MSETSSEKQDTTSLDEDSGHDSVDEISSERERIASLETAVNWIRDEVTQLKDYDRDILQELWRIRNTIHTIKDVHKKVRREESRFLDETIEDRSPTPESIPPETAQLEQKQQEKQQQLQKPQQLSIKPAMSLEPVSDRTSMVSSESDESPPPSPVQSPEFRNAEGEVYKMGTLQLMATAPTHLKKSSDEKLLEEFFGSDHVNKFGIFKSQNALDAVSNSDGNGIATEENNNDGQMTQGVSMPNIAVAPSNEPYTTSDQKQLQQQQGSPYKQYEANQPPVQRRLQVPRNPNGDANRMSYDVCSEMEKLRARLQETAIQELAEFDRKYSPKFLHATGNGGNLQVGGIADSFDGRRSGEISLNHSRQGSLDSSMSSQPTSSTSLIQTTNGVRGGVGGSSVGGGHVRQYSLPIDPNYYRQLQQERSSNGSTPPNMSPRGMRTAGIVIGRKVSGSSVKSSSHHASPSINNLRSPSPPPVGHVRQISGASVGSSESGTVSPPLVIGSGFQLPSGMGRLGDGTDPKGKQSKPPGMTRIPSNGPPNSSHHYHQQQQQQSSSLAMSSPAGISSFNNTNSNNRHSPEAQLPSSQPRSHSISHPHYATGALKRGKRNSGEIQGNRNSGESQGNRYSGEIQGNRYSGEIQGNRYSGEIQGNRYSGEIQGNRYSGESQGEQVSTYQSLYHHQHQQPQQQLINSSKPLSKTHSYDEKVRLGFRPHTYEKLSTVRDQVEAGSGGGYQDGFGKRPPSHPRMDTSILPASPRMGRAPVNMSASLGSSHSFNGKAPSEDIQPYMTSAQLKHQMKAYTPFSSHVQQQQRTQSMSAADPPRMQKRGSGSGGSGRSADQRTWI